MTPDQGLTLAAARLARSSPQNWDQFIGALRAYTDQNIQNCIQSPLDELPRTQGRAQAVARVLGILSDCLASADKIEGRRK